SLSPRRWRKPWPPSAGSPPATSTSSSRPTRRRVASRREQLQRHEHPDRDHRARIPRADPRGRPLLHGSRGRDEAETVLRGVSAGAREDETERNRVRHRRDPAWRLREDPWDAQAGAERPGLELRAGAAPRPVARRTGRTPETAGRGGRLRRGAYGALGSRRGARASTAASGSGASCPPRARRARGRAWSRRVLARADLEARPGDRGRPAREHSLRGPRAGARLRAWG